MYMFLSTIYTILRSRFPRLPNLAYHILGLHQVSSIQEMIQSRSVKEKATAWDLSILAIINYIWIMSDQFVLISYHYPVNPFSLSLSLSLTHTHSLSLPYSLWFFSVSILNQKFLKRQRETLPVEEINRVVNANQKKRWLMKVCNVFMDKNDRPHNNPLDSW